MDDVFLIQDDISVNVADAMKIVLDEPSRLRMQRAGVRNVEAFVEYQKARELFLRAHGENDLMGLLREGIVHFERAIELVPDFGAAFWEMSDYYGHVILEPNSTNEERVTALTELRRVLESAYQLSNDSPRRPMIDFDRVLFSDDWTLLHDRIEKALAPVKCPEPTWIEVTPGRQFEQAALEMWLQYQRCEPLAQSAPRQVADILGRQGQYEKAFDVLDDAEARLGSNAWVDASRQWLFLAQGMHEEALALAPRVVGDSAFFGMGAESLPLALSGDIDASIAAMEQWHADHGRNARSELEIYAATGNREQANSLAAELDARPGGPMVLLLAAKYCACGSPWDLEATPNFRARIEESGTEWPLRAIINYPSKDW